MAAKRSVTYPLQFIFGVRAVIETILAGKTIEKVFIQSGRKPVPILYKLIEEQAIPLHHVPMAKLNRLVNGNHQGIVAVVSSIPFAPLAEIVQGAFEAGRAPLVVVLDEVTDVHNLGAIVRTACCMGVDGVVLPMRRAASISGGAMKASAGALATLPICRVTHLNQALQYLQDSGLTILACHAQAAQPLYQVDLKLPIALILGGEERGISAAHLSYATHHIFIPMQGPIASLNVSVAAGIMLYEVFRQRFVI